MLITFVMILLVSQRVNRRNRIHQWLTHIGRSRFFEICMILHSPNFLQLHALLYFLSPWHHSLLSLSHHLINSLRTSAAFHLPLCFHLFHHLPASPLAFYLYFSSWVLSHPPLLFCSRSVEDCIWDAAVYTLISSLSP